MGGWTWWDFVLIHLVINSPMFCIGRLVQVIILRKHKVKWLYVFLIALISQAISLFITFHFSFETYNVLFIPALISEIAIVLLTWLYLKFNKKWITSSS